MIAVFENSSLLSLALMRQIAAILLIAVFAFTHYAKQLSYMECKLANMGKPSAQQCDCEKKFELVALDSKQPLSLLPQFFHVIDEFYSAAVTKVPVAVCDLLQAKSTTLSKEAVCERNAAAPFRPPRYN